MEPLSKGHFGTSHFVPCREAVVFSKINLLHIYTFGGIGSVPCREVVPFSEGPIFLKFSNRHIYIYTVSSSLINSKNKNTSILLLLFTLSCNNYRCYA